jgi:mannosyltransferase
MSKRSKKAARNAGVSTNRVTEWAKRHRIILLLISILLIALFLRFYELGTESIWLDEAESIHESALSVQQIAQHTNQPPLYFLILRIWIDLFGTSETALRSISAIFGVLAVGIVFLVGRSLSNPRVGLIGAFLASI